jgi:hypothetical protein
MSGFNDFLNIFFGSTQSQVTAYAILAAIIAICITVLLTKTDMGVGDKFLLIFFVILTLVPGVFLILFEITCMVTGGSKDKRWWCWLYAWVIAVFVVIYCILVVIISFSSLFTYNNAMENVELNEAKNKMSPQDSNDYAKALIQTNEYKEHFQNNDLQSTLNSLIASADKTQNREEGFYNTNEIINGIPTGKEVVKPKQKPTVSGFYGGAPSPQEQEKKPTVSGFYGGSQLYEGFATQKKAEEKEVEDETEKEVKKEEKEEKEDKEEKAKFTNKKESTKSKSVSLDEEEVEGETPEAVVEPFGNMNFGAKYSRY